jgi:hypothetical protein
MAPTAMPAIAPLVRPAFEFVEIEDGVDERKADVLGCPLCSDVEVASVVPVMLCGVPSTLDAGTVDGAGLVPHGCLYIRRNILQIPILHRHIQIIISAQRNALGTSDGAAE